MQKKNDVALLVLKLSKGAVYHASFWQPHAVKAEQKMKKRMGGGRGVVGKKTRLSETDCSLQRATIKLTKYHYQIFNKVAAIR